MTTFYYKISQEDLKTIRREIEGHAVSCQSEANGIIETLLARAPDEVDTRTPEKTKTDATPNSFAEAYSDHLWKSEWEQRVKKLEGRVDEHDCHLSKLADETNDLYSKFSTEKNHRDRAAAEMEDAKQSALRLLRGQANDPKFAGSTRRPKTTTGTLKHRHASVGTGVTKLEIWSIDCAREEIAVYDGEIIGVVVWNDEGFLEFHVAHGIKTFTNAATDASLSSVEQYGALCQEIMAGMRE